LSLEELKRVDELIRIASQPCDMSDYSHKHRAASYLADIRCLGLAIAMMMRDQIKPSDSLGAYCVNVKVGDKEYRSRP
jgi:hypothetical protein